MSDYYYNATPPGGYWDDEDARIAAAEERLVELSMADAVVDAAIEETLISRARRKSALKH